MNRTEDEELRRLFAEIRRQDEERVPAFQNVWTKAETTLPKSSVGVWRFAVAAVICLAVGALVYFKWHPNDTNQHTTVTLSEWKAPTDFLLQTPGMEIIQSSPSLNAQVSIQIDEGVKK